MRDGSNLWRETGDSRARHLCERSQGWASPASHHLGVEVQRSLAPSRGRGTATYLLGRCWCLEARPVLLVPFRVPNASPPLPRQSGSGLLLVTVGRMAVGMGYDAAS